MAATIPVGVPVTGSPPPSPLEAPGLEEEVGSAAPVVVVALGVALGVC